jgi:hypothetical protein
MDLFSIALTHCHADASSQMSILPVTVVGMSVVRRYTSSIGIAKHLPIQISLGRLNKFILLKLKHLYKKAWVKDIPIKNHITSAC